MLAGRLLDSVFLKKQKLPHNPRRHRKTGTCQNTALQICDICTPP